MVSSKNKSTFLSIFLAMGIIALSAPIYPVYAAGPSLISAKVTSTNTITLLWSEPVATSPGDYSGFTGSLSGAALMSVNGSGTNTITLTFNGTPFQPGATGYLYIGSGVYGISDTTYFSGGTFQVTSAVVPILQSFSANFNNINNAFSTVGSMVTISFTTNETVVNPTVTILGHTIAVNGNGSGPYTVNYTLVSGDQEGTIPVIVSFTDAQGNSGRATVNIYGSTNSSAAISGYITSDATTAGVLSVGGSIIFTLHLGTALPNAKVTGYYNGVLLSWYTNDGGATYTATYIVAGGQANQSTPLQITGVTVTDENGNTSYPISGYDVVRTINTNSSAPFIYVVTSVPSVVTTANPSYGFVSNVAGIIRYGGDCSGSVANAIAGTNNIIFNSLADGTHSNCSITVTDYSGNTSNQLFISPFTVQTGATATIQASGTSALTAQIQALQTQLAQLQTQAQQSNSAATTYKFLNPLTLGSTGQDVTELQQRLTTEGIYSGPITGYYGSLTETAVEKYQTLNGIEPLGNVGPATRAALNAGK